MRVFVHGLASEPPQFIEALKDQPESADGVHFFGAHVPGINGFDYAALHPRARYSGLFLSHAHRGTMASGQSDLLPWHYSQAYRNFQAMHFDLVVLQLPPLGSDDRFSPGVNSDFVHAAISGPCQVLAYINHTMPQTRGDGISADAPDYIVETEHPLPAAAAERGEPDSQTAAVARRAASLVEDGACLQIGIGRIPETVLRFLDGHRELGLHTGIVTDAVLPLIESGVITNSAKRLDKGLTVTGAAFGSTALYDALSHADVSIRNVSHTHAIETLAGIDNFVSINSAIEVDLMGQVNSEHIGDRKVSGVGGAVDFVRGAAVSPGGRAIIALPSVAASGSSRIVAHLAPGVPASISRADAPIIVTEFGVADLKNLSERERISALIGIAHPDHQEALLRAIRSQTL